MYVADHDTVHLNALGRDPSDVLGDLERSVRRAGADDAARELEDIRLAVEDLERLARDVIELEERAETAVLLAREAKEEAETSVSRERVELKSGLVLAFTRLALDATQSEIDAANAAADVHVVMRLFIALVGRMQAENARLRARLDVFEAAKEGV